MSDFRQGFLGVVFALLSGFVIFGGAVLSLVESNYVENKSASATYLAAWDMAGVDMSTPVPGEPTFTAVPVGRETLTPTPTFGPVAGCPVPEGWVSVMTQMGDTLESLALRYQVDMTQLSQANCLASDQLHLTPGIFLFVPQPTPTAVPSLPTAVEVLITLVKTPTKIICGVPYGWVAYRVRSGDTLYSLGSLTGVSVYQIQQANCMGSSTVIVTGQLLYLPFIPLIPVNPTATPVPTWTSAPPTLAPTTTVVIPTTTPTSDPATPTASSTSVTPTVTPTVSPSATLEQPTATHTSVPVTPSATPVPPSDTPVPPPIPTATSILPTPTSANPNPLSIWVPIPVCDVNYVEYSL